MSPTPLRRALLLSITVTAILSMGQGPAFAKKVVVMEFSGKGHKMIRQTVVKGLQKDHEIVPLDKVISEAKKMGLGNDCTETNVMGMSSLFGAEGVVCGALSGTADSRQLAMQVHNGGDGKEISRFEAPVGKWGLEEKVLATVLKKTKEALAKTWGWDTAGGGGEDAPSPPPAEPPAEEPPPSEPEGLPGDTPHPQPSESEEDPETADPLEPEEKPEDEVDPLEPEEKPPEQAPIVAAADDKEDPLLHSKPSIVQQPRATVKKKKSRASSRRKDMRHALRLALGASIRRWRSYVPVNLDPNTVKKDRNAQQVAKGYQPDPGAGVAVDLELFPGSFVTDHFAASIWGLGVSYALFHGPGWMLSDDPATHNTMQHEISADLLFRFALVNPWPLSATVKVGYKLRRFDMNDGVVQAPHPDVAFSGINIGVGLEAGIVREWLVFHGFFDFHKPLNLGEVADPSEYGAASGYGIAMGGGFRGKLWGPLGWRIEVEYARYTISFEHVTGEFQQWAEQVRDQYINGLILLTYTL